MKLNKPVIILLVVLFTVLAAVVAVPAILSTESAYDNYLKEARDYNEKNLCEKAMMAYDNALAEEDSLDLRIEMAANFKQGLENGEFNSFYKFSNFLFDMLDAYRKEPKAYDTVVQYFFDFGRIEDCVSVIYQAEEFGITTDTVDKVRDEVRYMCLTSYGSYEDVVMTHEDSYLIKNEAYALYNAKLGSVDGVRYEFATPMINGFALVKTAEYTFLISEDTVREAYFPEELTDATGVGDSLIAVKVGEKYKYYNLAGEVVFGEYDYAGRFANGIAPVKNGDKWFIIGTDGKQISDKTFEDIKLSQTNECSQHGLIFAKSGGKYYLYDASLNRISDTAFDDADVFMHSNECAAVKVGDKWGYINSKGEIVIKAQYENAKSFSNGLAGIKDGEFWSFIDADNKKVITGEYCDVNYFNVNGYCFVKGNNYWYYIMRYYNR